MSGAAGSRSFSRWSSGLFSASGVLMFVQVILIGLKRHDIGSFSELWIVPLAVSAVVAGLIALIGLNTGLSPRAPRLAKAGAVAAMAAIALLGIALVWLISSAPAKGQEISLPGGFFALAGLFIAALVLAFILIAAASLKAGLRAMGYLLLVPALSWGAIIVAGAITNMSDALRLDFYTNAAIACAFVALGFVMRKRTPGSVF